MGSAHQPLAGCTRTKNNQLNITGDGEWRENTHDIYLSPEIGTVMDDLYYVKVSADQLRRLQENGVQFSHWRSGSIAINGAANLEAAANALNCSMIRQGRVFNGLTQVKLKPVRQRRGRNTAVARNEQRMSRAREQYIQACSARFGELRRTAQDTFVPIQAELRKSETALVAAARRAGFAQEESRQALMQRFEQELQQIRETAKVTEVLAIANGIIVYTDTLYATAIDTARVYEIGRFAIWIRFAGSNAGITWSNCSRRIDVPQKAMNAPYIYANGQASHDDIRLSLLELIGRLELSTVVDLAIQYVETINAEHPLTAYIDSWPSYVPQTGGNASPRRSGLIKRAKRGLAMLLRRRTTA
jgi:hypothetical protein